jgi:hypothetical protein
MQEAFKPQALSRIETRFSENLYKIEIYSEFLSRSVTLN